MSIASRISRFVGSRSFGKAAPDTEAPSVPANLAASSITATTLTLTWDPSTDNVGVVSYEVEQRTSAGPGAWTWLATVAHPTTTVNVTGLTEITSYDFRVRAVDLAGNMSAWAELLNVVTADETAPTVPANLAASNIAATTLDLTWDPSTDNVGVVEYEVQQRLASGVNGDYVTIATVAAPTVTLAVTGLTAATEYRFRVRAKDAAGNFSAWGPDDDGLAVTSLWGFVAPSTNNGVIDVIIPDGSGGWYIGGTFTSITDSVATYTTGYTRLVRLAPDGKIDPAFSCPVNIGGVLALALDSTGLYVAGNIPGTNTFGTATRNNIARIRPFNDPAPGAVDAWRPDFNNTINTLTLDSANSKLYAGGFFTATGGAVADYASATRIRIARVTTGASATLDAWRPDFNDTVVSLCLDSANSKLYVGGDFTATGGASADYASATRNRIARVTTGTSATLDAWRPDFGSSVRTLTLDSANSKLYAGGFFTATGGAGADYASATRNRIARVTTGTSATLDAWNPNSSLSLRRVRLDVDAGFVYLAGGNAATVGGVARSCLARVSNGVTATVDAWNPNITLPSTFQLATDFFKIPGAPFAVVVGDFNAVANHAVSVGNDIAGLNL